MQRVLETEDFRVKFEETAELKEQVFERVLAFLTKHEAFYGESLMQSDGPQIEAPDFLAELVDEVFQFDAEFKD